MDARDVREQNRRSWNAAVPVHDSHRGDQSAFFRAGGSTLFPEERELLGELRGRAVAHLLCNAGQDSVSLALEGADVVGVDLSDAAVAAAGELAAAAGVAARFDRADVLDWLSGQRERFDVVFASYGVTCWLPDLDAFASCVATALRAGGRFVLVDFHPVAGMFDERWRLSTPYYRGGEPLVLDGVGDYVGEARGGLTPAGFVDGVGDFRNPEPCVLYRWGLGEVLTALAGAGLTLRTVREYPFANGERHFAGMRAAPGRRMLPPDGMPALPLMYGLLATR